MSTAADILSEVSAQIDADPQTLDEARERLQLVREIAESFDGRLRTYRSGSLAAHTMIDPVTDGDGGIVLDRRYHTALGPEGKGETPGQIVDDLREYVASVIRDTYPNAWVTTTKRGPKVYFGQPLNNQNPTVDLVLALTRKEGAGLWIPNLNTGRWEPSDPEKHISLLETGTPSHKSIRRKVIRLAKAWNNQYSKPGVSSFLLSVWAYEFMKPGKGVPAGLHALFEGAALRLEANEPTPDPARVAPDLKLLLGQEIVRDRVRDAADTLQEAISHNGDEEATRASLSRIFHTYLDSPEQSDLAAAAAHISTKKPLTSDQLGLKTRPVVIPPTRSFGTAV